MSDLDVTLAADVTLEIDCPKCHVAFTFTVEKELATIPHCIDCGWTGTFGITIPVEI